MPRRFDGQQNGGDALAAALSRFAPSRVPISPLAMFRTMERSGRGREFLSDAGVNASARTQLNWLTGESSPNAANQRAINKAYDRWAGSNARQKAGSNRPGSTTIEIYPGAGGADQYGRPQVNIAIDDIRLGRAIELANRGDTDGLNELWDNLIEDQLSENSPPAKAYRVVSHVWIGG